MGSLPELIWNEQASLVTKKRKVSVNCTKVGWYDKIQILDFGLTHKTGGANHKINDFCFLKFFISIKFDPHQAQKMIFRRFEQCSISLDMFERVKWPVLQNLSLISIIMRIHEKKIGTLSTEIGPAATKIVKFWPKKAYLSMGT